MSRAKTYPGLRICAGDETGLVKHCSVGETSRIGDVVQSRSISVADMCLVDKQLYTLRINGVIDVCETGSSADSSMEVVRTMETSITNPIGLSYLHNNTIAVYNSDGSIQILNTATNASQTMDVTGPLSVLRGCNGGFAVGGKERDLQLFDATTMQSSWKAKNVPHDNLKYVPCNLFALHAL
jgi:hypothetical protein